MQTIIDLNLFQVSNNKIICMKLAERLDNTVSRSPEINLIKTKVSATTQSLRSSNVAEKIRIDKNREDKNRLYIELMKPKHKKSDDINLIFDYD